MKYIIANWKMNPASLDEAKKLAKASDVEGLVICPPFLFIEEVGLKIKKAKLGAQDLFWEEKGAFTGEISTEELKSVGAEYVIIGHSERRKNLGETDEMVAKKMAAALKAGLKPILCVGEPREIRDKGKTKEFVENELRIGLSRIITEPAEIVVAYEPIWAIGTGNPDTPENMANMVKFIKDLLVKLGSKLKAHVIYGGSVTSANAESFLKYKEIEGALVGGASLKGDEITKIVEIGKKFK
jgi:triosephosphate isomerase